MASATSEFPKPAKELVAAGAPAQPRERRRELGLVDARERDHVPVVARLAPDDLGEPDRCRVYALAALIWIDRDDERVHLVEHLGCDRLRRQARRAATRATGGEAAGATDDVAEEVPAAGHTAG